MFIFAAEIRANSDAIGRNMVLEIPRAPEIRDVFHYKDAIPKVEPFAPGGQGVGNWYSANCLQKLAVLLIDAAITACGPNQAPEASEKNAGHMAGIQHLNAVCVA
jgi:hypothetical protein